MGKMIFPGKDWDNRDGGDRHRYLGPRKRLAQKLYIGYGYFIYTFQDGTKILAYDSRINKPQLLGDFEEFDQKGFPVNSIEKDSEDK